MHYWSMKYYAMGDIKKKSSFFNKHYGNTV